MSKLRNLFAKFAAINSRYREPRIEMSEMAEPSEVLEPAEITVDGDKPRGFWASLFKRKK